MSEGNPSLKLDELRREYAYAAKAFAAGPDADKVFFFEAALEVTQKPFAMLQVRGAARSLQRSARARTGVRGGLDRLCPVITRKAARPAPHHAYPPGP